MCVALMLAAGLAACSGATTASLPTTAHESLAASPTALPTTAHESLAASPTALPTSYGVPLGHLNWGHGTYGAPRTDAELRTASAGTASDISRTTRRVIEVATRHIDLPVAVVVTIDREGVVFSDPRYRASDAAIQSISDLYLWAVCARAAETSVAARCTERVVEGLDTWSNTYRSTGNPINDSYLVPAIQAVDLACPVTSPERCARWRRWILDLALRGDEFYAKVKPTDGRYANNWASWRLLIRGMAGAVGDDSSLVRSTRDLVTAHVTRNLRADGSSVDFHERDSLHYHVYALEPLVQLALFVPDAIDPTSATSIESGLLFLRPFVLGERTHVEFAQTKVAFDLRRKQAGDPVFADSLWNPKDARPLLRLARTRFVTVRAWTTALVDEDYAPRIKQLAALHEP